MKLTMISQMMKNLKNTLKLESELATKIMIDHGKANRLCRIGNHKYKVESYPSHQSGEYFLNITNDAHIK